MDKNWQTFPSSLLWRESRVSICYESIKFNSKDSSIVQVLFTLTWFPAKEILRIFFCFLRILIEKHNSLHAAREFSSYCGNSFRNSVEFLRILVMLLCTMPGILLLCDNSFGFQVTISCKKEIHLRKTCMIYCRNSTYLFDLRSCHCEIVNEIFSFHSCEHFIHSKLNFFL